MTRVRWILVAFFVLAVSAAVFRGARDRTVAEHDGRPTTENPQPRGARALALWLDEFGYPTSSWRRPLTELDSTVAVLTVLAPSQELTEAQADDLLTWVEGGRVLLVAPGADVQLDRVLERFVALDFDYSEASDVRGDRVVPKDGLRWRYREVTPDEAGQFDWPVREVAFLTSERVSDTSGEHSILFPRGDTGGLVAEIYHGDGMILVFADVNLLTNAGLARADNVNLVASLITDWIEPGTRIWFDDYDHGLREGGSLVGYLQERWPARFALVLLCVTLLGILRYGRALVVRPETRLRRRDPTEFVDALGGLYDRARAVPAAWSALATVTDRVLDGSWLAPRVEPVERERRAKKLRTALALGRRARGATDAELEGLAKALAEALKRS